MQMEMLVDHTGLHALSGKSAARDERVPRFADLMQMVEHLLLADVIWTHGAVSGPTRLITESVLTKLCDFGLANSRGTGLVRMATITDPQYSSACAKAVPFVLGSVRRMRLVDLAGCADEAGQHPVRPKGVTSENYPSVAQLTPASKRADRFLKRAQKTLQWEKTASPLLVDERLHRYLENLIREDSDPKHVGYTQLNTILRWRINEQLAEMISTPPATVVYYTPAYGRARAIDAQVRCLWGKNRGALAEKLAALLKHYAREKSEWENLIIDLGPTSDSDVPLFGVWLLLQLPEDCTLERLLEEIRRRRDDITVKAAREFIAAEDPDGITEVCKEVDARLRRERGLGSARETMYTSKTKIIFRWWWPPVVGQKEIEIKSVESVVRWALGRKKGPITSLTGFVNQLISESDVYRRAQSRAKSIWART